MGISTGEKLIIAMLCDLHKEDARKEIDPQFVMEALVDRHEWALAWRYQGLFESDEIETPAEVRQVVDILEMWEFIEESYEGFDDKGKELVAERAAPFGENPQFRGFDGNNETEHFSIARFLVGPLGRWSRFEGRDLNAHMPSLATYGRMLTVFNAIKDEKDFDFTFTPEEIGEILKAKNHDYEFKA